MRSSFPFMSFRDGHVAGIPARVYRISFTGELSYEINVAPSYALALWQALMSAGEKYGVTPYGTEAMHVLRCEKGFVIVGPGNRRHGDAAGSGHGLDRQQEEEGFPG